MCGALRPRSRAQTPATPRRKRSRRPAAVRGTGWSRAGHAPGTRCVQAPARTQARRWTRGKDTHTGANAHSRTPRAGTRAFTHRAINRCRTRDGLVGGRVAMRPQPPSATDSSAETGPGPSPPAKPKPPLSLHRAPGQALGAEPVRGGQDPPEPGAPAPPRADGTEAGASPSRSASPASIARSRPPLSDARIGQKV